jgi:8-oxo-dGTP pyrophosphatase MutT (NUDIX family)
MMETGKLASLQSKTAIQMRSSHSKISLGLSYGLHVLILGWAGHSPPASQVSKMAFSFAVIRYLSLLRAWKAYAYICTSFPYSDKDPEAYANIMKALYTLVWDDGETTTPIGYLKEDVFNKLVKVPTLIKGDLEVRRSKRELSVFQQATEEERSQRAAATAEYWRTNQDFKVLSGWRSELYPVYGPKNELLYSIERSASSLLGVVTYGVHMTAYVRSPESSHGMKIWIPRRAAGKQTYGGMLDNTVAGGMATGEGPLECLVREAEEEASLPRDLVEKSSTSHGTITYIYIRTAEATGEIGLIQPECQYVYDLELPADMIPKPNDSEVQEFYLWDVEEVQEHMTKGEFKPNCALIMLDFFIRHGILTPENENDYDEIKSRIHRDLKFPGPHGKA